MSDLACNDGRMARGAGAAGAAHVTGIDIPDESIAEGRETRRASGNAETTEFVTSDVFACPANAVPGRVDVIPWLGVLDHIAGDPAPEREVSADRPVARVAVRLVDLWPDGAATRVAFGVLNLRHRGGVSRAPRTRPSARACREA